MNPTLLLIDGNAIMHRAYHAIPAFKTKSGVPTNVIYGFFSMLQKAVTDLAPTHIAVCFDTPKPTFRNKMYKEYQAQRPQIGDDFIVQIPLLHEALKKAGVVFLAKDGYEADDLIGTLATISKKNMQVYILTGDKDIMQLVNSHVKVVSPQTGMSSIKLYDEKEVKSKLGIAPHMIPELKGLMGDPSDNYPGAKGIGPKTAIKLLEQFGSVEGILKHTEEIENNRWKTIIQEQKKNIIMSKKLATIVTNIPLDITIDQLAFKGFHLDLKNYFIQYEMKSMLARFFGERPKEVELEKEAKKKDKPPQLDLFS
ncbi:MAG: 5'-3' exonuclease H3TH domain-containing protein [bacterium]|nr:5'-3' exonuclease H3TH domain-containing protein [bacterium]